MTNAHRLSGTALLVHLKDVFGPCANLNTELRFRTAAASSASAADHGATSGHRARSRTGGGA